MRSMTVKEAKASFDRMLEAAKREGVVLRDDGKDVAAIVSSREYALFHKWRGDRLLKAMDELAAQAASNGLTEEKLAELLRQPD